VQLPSCNCPCTATLRKPLLLASACKGKTESDGLGRKRKSGSLGYTGLGAFIYPIGDRGDIVIKVLCYKSEGSIPVGVIGIFHSHKILPIVLWPWDRLSL